MAASGVRFFGVEVIRVGRCVVQGLHGDVVAVLRAQPVPQVRERRPVALDRIVEAGQDAVLMGAGRAAGASQPRRCRWATAVLPRRVRGPPTVPLRRCHGQTAAAAPPPPPDPPRMPCGQARRLPWPPRHQCRQAPLWRPTDAPQSGPAPRSPPPPQPSRQLSLRPLPPPWPLPGPMLSTVSREEIRAVSDSAAARRAAATMPSHRPGVGGSMLSARQRTSSSTRTCSGLRSLRATCSARYAVSFSPSATLHSRKPRCSRICARWYSTVRPVQS